MTVRMAEITIIFKDIQVMTLTAAFVVNQSISRVTVTSSKIKQSLTVVRVTMIVNANFLFKIVNLNMRWPYPTQWNKIHRYLEWCKIRTNPLRWFIKLESSTKGRFQAQQWQRHYLPQI
jgi:hypothetical protein